MTSSYVGSLSPLATYFNSMSNVSGSGNYTNYYSTAMGSNANFSSEEDYNSYMNALYNDREVSMSSQLGTRNGDKVTKLASTMQTALHEGDSKLVKQILTSIEDDPTTLASLEIAYGNAAGSPTALRDDIRKSLNNWSTEWPVLSWIPNLFRNTVGKLLGFDTISEGDAIGILNKGAEVSTQVSANALKNALNQGVIFKDRETINEILDNSGFRMNEIMNLYDGDLIADIKDQYVWVVDGLTTENEMVNKVTNSLYA